MANTYVTSGRFSNKEIANLKEILEINLKHYGGNVCASEKDYMRRLKTVLGLGFTAALIDETFLTMYQSKLNIFLENRNFKENPLNIPYLCQQIAEMISLSVQLFSYIPFMECPYYYPDFKESLKKLLCNLTTQLAGKNEEAERILRLV